MDNDPLSSSYGDVYVVSENFIEKFDSSGKFLLSFGGEEGTGNGQFSGGTGAVSVGPEGKVYVGDKARVQVFEPSGVWLENISLASLSSEFGPRSLAVDMSGDLFVKDNGVSGVREFEPDGTEKATQFDAGSTTVTALAVDGSGDLFVGESSEDASPGTFHVLEYSPSGEDLASFDNESGLGFRPGMTFASALGVGELYVSTLVAPEAKVTMVPVPVSGPPVIESGSVSATAGQRGDASLAATIDAQGNVTSYRVEYVDEASFQEGGFENASSTPEVLLGSKFEEVPVTVALNRLIPGETYHYRIFASSSAGSEASPDQVFTEVPPALIDGPWAEDVTTTSATFAAEIDPLGLDTEYRLEYGPTTAYGTTLSGSLGEGEGYVPASFHRQDLSPGTTYHYRMIVHNEAGVYAGPDHTLTTQVAGGQELSLPDGRAWELVSPADKKGALVGPMVHSKEPDQAAVDGSGLAYQASEPVGEDVVGHFVSAETLSMRGVNGWSSQSVAARDSLPPEGARASEVAYGSGSFDVFSTDLSLTLYEAGTGISVPPPPQSPEATERTLYLRNSATGKFLPLETQTDVVPGKKFNDKTMKFLAGTPDLSHVIFGSTVALTPEAVEGETKRQNLYEWSAGGLQLVNITPATPEAPNGTTEPDAHLGSRVNESEGMTARAISSDGRWVVWAHGELLGGAGVASTPPVSLYVRDMLEKKTFKLGGDYPRFETMSSDGSRVFFVETSEGHGGDLYVFDTETGIQTDLTADHGAGEANAGVQDAVMGASEDGSYIYFVATGALASGAVKDADNVYVAHDTAGGWTTKYIATLSGEDSKSWRGGEKEAPAVESSAPPELNLVSSRVSPNGRYLSFMSERSLTGYDNLDAVSGQPDEEVYLYDADQNRLVCASCNPTGARPVGVFDDREFVNSLFADLETAWSHNLGSGDHWLAGSVPGWETTLYGVTPYQPRYLSDSGRLFFDSPDALVPQDTNGLEDVYEYEPVASSETVASDNCTTASETYSAVSGGCVSLISSGQSSGESIFVDASENGNDVFFDTNSKLTGEDYDTSYDIYDAHVCSTEAPCRSEPVVPPPCTSGDSCKAAPAPQPEIFGPAPSATFSGIGNVVEEAKPSVVKHKTKKKAKPKSQTGKHKKHKKRKAKKAHKTRSNRKGR
ncbi:MAG: hypothetical protein WBQ21_00760 [Solirubrobacteraceae bacterium]